jgi:hypothetical protein
LRTMSGTEMLRQKVDVTWDTVKWNEHKRKESERNKNRISCIWPDPKFWKVLSIISETIRYPFVERSFVPSQSYCEKKISQANRPRFDKGYGISGATQTIMTSELDVRWCGSSLNRN